jgi:hypothetical protein
MSRQDNNLWKADDQDDINALADFAEEYIEPEPAPTPEPESEEESEEEIFVDEDDEGDAETEEGEYEEEGVEGDNVAGEAGVGEPALPIRSCFRCLDDFEAEPGQDYCPVCRAQHT